MIPPGEKYGTGTLSLMLPTYHYDPITTEITGSNNVDDVRNSQILEFNFWTGHSLRSDADGYISKIEQASGINSDGLTEITLTGSKYQSHYIDTSVFALGLGAAGQNNQNISSDPFVYTIHDAQNTGETDNLYTVLSVKENEMQYEVLGLEYVSGKYQQVEEEFSIEGPTSAYFSRNAPKAPSIKSFYFDAEAVPEVVELEVLTAQKEIDGRVVQDPEHNTSLLFAYMHRRELLEDDATNQHDTLSAAENYFADHEDFVNSLPSDPDGSWKDFGIATASAQTMGGIVEDIDVSKSPGIYSFAFFGMNYFGTFSSPTYAQIAILPSMVKGNKRITDVEIAGLSTNDAEAIQLQYGDNSRVLITDFTSFAYSWSANTFGEDSFLNTYGFLDGTVTKWTSNTALPTATELQYLITIRDESTTFVNGVPQPSTNIYNFKTYTEQVRSSFQSLENDCVNKAKYIKPVFTIEANDRHTPASENTSAESMTMADLFDFVTSQTDNSRINYAHEYGPPRRYEIVVELINKNIQTEAGTAANKGLVTSASNLGLGNFAHTTDLSTDEAGVNTGYDTLTIYNRRLPVFYLKKSTETIEWKNVLESRIYADGNDYSSTDLNSENAYVLLRTGSGTEDEKEDRIYKQIRTYAGTKAPRTAAGEGYWMEVDAICEASLIQKGNVITILPELLVFITAGDNNSVTETSLSRTGFGHQRFNDALFGGFYIITSNLKFISSQDLYSLTEGLGLGSKEFSQEVESIEEGGGTTTQNKAILLQDEAFEDDEEDSDEGDTDLEVDSEPQGEDFTVVEKREIEMQVTIPNNHKFLTLSFYDRFDKSVIEEYGRNSNEANNYRTKGMVYSNVIDISSDQALQPNTVRDVQPVDPSEGFLV